MPTEPVVKTLASEILPVGYNLMRPLYRCHVCAAEGETYCSKIY